MATITGPSLPRLVLTHLLTRANTPHRTRTWNFGGLFNAIFKAIAHLAGFSALTYAGYTVNLTIALVVGGLSCFTLSWLVTSDQPTATVEPMIRSR